MLAECGAKALVAHADLLPAVARAIPAGVQVLVVETPPEIAGTWLIVHSMISWPASVAIARESPLMRRLGMPTRTPNSDAINLSGSGAIQNPLYVCRRTVELLPGALLIAGLPHLKSGQVHAAQGVPDLALVAKALGIDHLVNFGLVGQFLCRPPFVHGGLHTAF